MTLGDLADVASLDCGRQVAIGFRAECPTQECGGAGLATGGCCRNAQKKQVMVPAHKSTWGGKDSYVQSHWRNQKGWGEAISQTS